MSSNIELFYVTTFFHVMCIPRLYCKSVPQKRIQFHNPKAKFDIKL